MHLVDTFGWNWLNVTNTDAAAASLSADSETTVATILESADARDGAS